MPRPTGTTLATLAGLSLPYLTGMAMGGRPVGAAAGLAAATTTLLPGLVVLLVLLAVFGRRRAIRRAGRYAWAAGSQLVTRRPDNPGRALLVRDGTHQYRIHVARDIDLPVGSRIQVRGVSHGGITHAWFYQVESLDHRPHPCRGVRLALLSVFAGTVASLLAVVAALA